MSETVKKYVLELLTNYHENQLQIALLRYEMEHPAHITAGEMIESLTFGHSDFLGGTPGHISNKTLYIALNYQDKAKRANAEAIDDIAIRLNELEQQQKRLSHYLDLMEEEYATILRAFYFENKSTEDIAQMLHIHPRTVFKRKERALDRLCEMYAFTAGTHHSAEASNGQHQGSNRA